MGSAALLNIAHVKKYLLDEAQQQGKPRLTRVSGRTMEYLDGELRKNPSGWRATNYIVPLPYKEPVPGNV